MVGDKREHRCTLIAVSLPLLLPAVCVCVWVWCAYSICVCVCAIRKLPITTKNSNTPSSILASKERKKKKKDSSPERSHLSASCWSYMSTKGSECLSERGVLSAESRSTFSLLSSVKRHIALSNLAWQTLNHGESKYPRGWGALRVTKLATGVGSRGPPTAACACF